MESNGQICFRARRKLQIVGIGSIVTFSLFGLLSVYGAYFNIDGSFDEPLLAAAVFGLLCSCFIALGVWLLVFSIRYRLCHDGSTLQEIGIIRNRHLTLSKVDQLKWRRHPAGGSVRITSAEGVLKIDFANFEREQREELISLLRDSVPLNAQTCWKEFRKHFEYTPERHARTRRIRSLLIFLFVAHAIAFLVLSLLGFGLEYLLYAIANALVSVYLVRTNRNLQASPSHVEPIDTA